MAQVIQGYCRDISRFCSKIFAFDYCGKNATDYLWSCHMHSFALQTERNKCKQPKNNDNKVKNSISQGLKAKIFVKQRQLSVLEINNKTK